MELRCGVEACMRDVFRVLVCTLAVAACSSGAPPSKSSGATSSTSPQPPSSGFADTQPSETASASVSPTIRPESASAPIGAILRVEALGNLVFILPPVLRYHANGFTSSVESIDAYYANVPLGSSCAHGCGLASFDPLPDNAVVVEFASLGLVATQP